MNMCVTKPNTNRCCRHTAIASGGGGVEHTNDGSLNEASYIPLPFSLYFYTNLVGTKQSSKTITQLFLILRLFTLRYP